jgi:hypothetical protein
MGDTPTNEVLPLAKGSQSGERLKTLRVEVTQDIIETALPANSGHCMISDAVKLAAEGRRWRISKVLTDLQTIRFTDLKKRIRYICFTPRIGQIALLAFDQGQRPEPFSFRLKAVQIIQKQPRVKGQRARRGKARIAVQVRQDSTNQRPIKHGGHEIPTTVGLRREFGLRGLGVWKAPSEVATTVEAS